MARFKVTSENRAEALEAILGMEDDKGKRMFPSRSSGGNEVILQCPICGKKKLYADRLTGRMYCFVDGSTFPDKFLADSLAIPVKEAETIIGSLLGVIKSDVTFSYSKTEYKEASQDLPIAADKVLNIVYNGILNGIGKGVGTGTQLSGIDRGSLIARGFTKDEISQLRYASLYRASIFNPHDKKVWTKHCNALIRENEKYIPEGTGVPGREQNKYNNDWIMHQPSACGILLPVRNRHYQIVRLNLARSIIEDNISGRRDKDAPKYFWFTSGGRRSGCAASAVVHYACAWEKRGETYSDIYPVFKDGVVYITEGILKADLAHCISPEMGFLAIPGVGMLSPLIEELKWLLEENIIKKAVIAFDMDYQNNPNVEKAMNKLKEAIRELKIPATYLKWERYQGEEDLKGIDDYLAYRYRGIKPSDRKK